MMIHGSEPRHGDAEQVRVLYLAAMRGWNAGSGESFAAAFTDDVDFVAFDGARFRGRDALVRFHDPLFKTHLKGTRLLGDVTDVRFVTPDVAVLHAFGGTVARGKSEPARERDSLQTFVAIRRDDRWQLTAFQNTRVRPIGQNHLGNTVVAHHRLVLEMVSARAPRAAVDEYREGTPTGRHRLVRNAAPGQPASDDQACRTTRYEGNNNLHAIL